MSPGPRRELAGAAFALLLLPAIQGCASPGRGSPDTSTDVPRTSPSTSPTPSSRGATAPARDSPGATAPEPPVESLERRVGFSRRGRLAPDERRLFALPLEEGEYVEVHLDPGPEDARIESFAPGVEPGAESSEATSTGEHAPETTGQVLWDLAAEPGVHHLLVTPTGEEPIAYRLQVRALRPATDQDRARKRCLREREAGDALWQADRLEEALEQYDRAEEECEAGSYLAGLAEIRALRGRLLVEIGRLDAARHDYRAAVGLRRELGNSRSLVEQLLRFSDLESRGGQWDPARRLLAEAESVAKDIGDPALLAKTAFFTCVLRVYEGSVQPAIEVCERAAKRLRGHGPRGFLGPALKFLGSLHYLQGDLAAAREMFEQSMALARERSDRPLLAALRNDLALLERAEGDFDRALAWLQESFELYEETGNRAYAARVLSNIGGLHERLGNLDAALDYFTQALERTRDLGQRVPQIQMLLDIGAIHQQRGHLQLAQEHFERSLELSREVGNPRHRASALQSMGALHLARQEPEQALEVLEEGLEECHESGNSWREAVILAELARAHSQLGEPEEGLDLLVQASAINDRLGNRTRLAENHHLMARLERQRGDRAAAMEAIERALAVAAVVRPLLGADDLRSFFTATTRPFHELRIELLMEAHRTDADVEHAVEALRESERARARSLREILADARLEPSSDVPEELLAESAEVQRRLHAEEMKRQDLLSQREAGSDAVTRVDVRIEGLLTKLREVERRMRGESPDYAALTATDPLTLDAIQETVLDPETTLLEYWLGEEESFLWVVTDQEFRSYRLPGRREIEADARCLHWLVSAYGEPPAADEMPAEGSRCLGGEAVAYLEASEGPHPLRVRSQRRAALDAAFRKKAARLSETILAPAARDGLLSRRLAVVSDGALEYVPFAALPNPTAENGPLVRSHELVRLASASVLAFQRSRADGGRRPQGVLAVIADPVYTPEDRRLASATRGAVQGIPADGTPADGTALSFHRLDFAGREAETIASLMPSDRVFVARGSEASRETVLTTDLSGYRYVHFAAHGVIDTQYPRLSGLVLSLVDSQGRRRENGFLRLHDIYDMELDGVDMVVLSACETALGREIRGEGLVGLTRGFLYAGAERVVASLWPVQDLATARLMEELYTRLLRRGRSPGEALRGAQASLLDDPAGSFSHPYYWAGFVLQGEWR